MNIFDVAPLILQTIGDTMPKKEEWLLCPVCGSKTKTKIRPDTTLTNFPLFCPKCKHETVVNVQQLNMSVIKEPDAQTQSR